jgi:hypothetical protein
MQITNAVIVMRTSFEGIIARICKRSTRGRGRASSHNGYYANTLYEVLAGESMIKKDRASNLTTHMICQVMRH